jgi:glycerol-3-phosphate dehydrogenase
LAQQFGVDMPISFAVDRLLNHGAALDSAVAELVSGLGQAARAG